MLLSAQQHQFFQTSANEQRIDLNITNTIERDTRIELFNYLFSNTVVYNPQLAVNGVSYYPISVSSTPVVIATPNVADGYINAYLMGGIDAFTDNAQQGPWVPNSSKNYCFFDEFGQLVYKPGYEAGVQVSGSLTVQSKQTNYNHVFRTLGNAAIYLRRIKVTTQSAYANSQLQNDFKFVSQNITASTGSNNQGTSSYQNEYANQANIVTMPINQAIDPNSGLWYTIAAYNGADLNTVQLTVFFVPMTQGML